MPVLATIEKQRTIPATHRKTKTLRVAELFAGVGGFRLGLEAVRDPEGRKTYDILWSNQWEPSTKVQHASDIYIKRFGNENHSNEDIANVDADEIPDHDFLVGGFPCQDYSVARTLNQAVGIVGKKGVLWWQIHRILKEKKNKPKYLILENVDRLLKSPAQQRGRDFAIMLASLSELGYAVEWRVINAADHGFPQRRRRIFLVGYHRTTLIYKELRAEKYLNDWVEREGLFAKAFPIVKPDHAGNAFKIEGDLVRISNSFGINDQHSVFFNAGAMKDRKVYTIKTHPDFRGKQQVLHDVLLDDKEVPEEYYIKAKDLPEWRYLKGAKDIPRKNKRTGFKYYYSEGPMAFPDKLDKPARTIVTGEGGSTPSRFKHIIRTKSGRYRRLMPVELERLNGFPDNHTAGFAATRRAFFMGNALVVGVVKRIAETLSRKINLYSE